MLKVFAHEIQLTSTTTSAITMTTTFDFYSVCHLRVTAS